MKFLLYSLVLNSFGTVAHAACETVFAYCPKASDTSDPTPPNAKVTTTKCFSSTSPSFKRWGWVHNQTACTPPIICTLYAGAVGCDRTKGTIVGTAVITSTNFQINLNSPWEYAPGPLNATDEGSTVVHFYHGTKQYPLTGGTSGAATVAPVTYDSGYLTRQDGFYTIQGGGLKPKESFILHASVCTAVSLIVLLSQIFDHTNSDFPLSFLLPTVSQCITFGQAQCEAIGPTKR